jgi:hypothetical protein
VSFGYYNYQVTALTAIFLYVEEYVPLILRVKGNIKQHVPIKQGWKISF